MGNLPSGLGPNSSIAEINEARSIYRQMEEKASRDRNFKLAKEYKEKGEKLLEFRLMREAQISAAESGSVVETKSTNDLLRSPTSTKAVHRNNRNLMSPLTLNIPVLPLSQNPLSMAEEGGIIRQSTSGTQPLATLREMKALTEQPFLLSDDDEDEGYESGEGYSSDEDEVGDFDQKSERSGFVSQRSGNEHSEFSSTHEKSRTPANRETTLTQGSTRRDVTVTQGSTQKRPERKRPSRPARNPMRRPARLPSKDEDIKSIKDDDDRSTIGDVFDKLQQAPRERRNSQASRRRSNASSAILEDSDEDSEDEFAAEDRIAADWLQSGPVQQRIKGAKIMCQGDIEVKRPNWEWSSKYFVLYETLGLWIFKNKQEAKKASRAPYFQPNEFLGHDKEYEKRMNLSKNRLKTEFVLRGTYTTSGVCQLARWHCQAYTEGGKTNWIKNFDAVARNIYWKHQTDLRNRKQFDANDKKSFTNMLPIAFVSHLVKKHLSHNVRRAAFVFHREFMSTESFFKILLQDFEYYVDEARSIVNSNPRTNSIPTIMNLASCFEYWIDLCPEDIFSRREWFAPGDFIWMEAKKKKDDDDDNYLYRKFRKQVEPERKQPAHHIRNLRTAKKMQDKKGIGGRLLIFLKNIHMCGTANFSQHVFTGKATFIKQDLGFLKKLNMKFFKKIQNLIEKLEALKERIDAPPRVFLELGRPPKEDTYDMRNLRLDKEKKHEYWETLKYSFEDVHHMDRPSMLRFFRRTNPYFFSEGILNFRSKEIAETFMVHDLELLKSVPLSSLATVKHKIVKIAHGKTNRDIIADMKTRIEIPEIKCEKIQRVQTIFARRVLWIAYEILRKFEEDQDENAHLSSICRLMIKFIQIGEASLESKNQKFTNHYLVYAIVHAFSLDYIEVHVHHLEKTYQNRLNKLKSLCLEDPVAPMNIKGLFVPRISAFLTRLFEIRHKHPPPLKKGTADIYLYDDLFPTVRAFREIQKNNEDRLYVPLLDAEAEKKRVQARHDAAKQAKKRKKENKNVENIEMKEKKEKKEKKTKPEGYIKLKALPSIQLYLHCALDAVPSEPNLILSSELAWPAQLYKEEKHSNRVKAMVSRRKQSYLKGIAQNTGLSTVPIVVGCALAFGYTLVLAIAFSGREEYSVQYVRAFLVGLIHFLATFNFLYIYWFECRNFWSPAAVFEVHEMSLFAKNNWFIWAISSSSFIGTCYFVTDSFNGTDVSKVSTDINYYMMLVLANIFLYFVVILIMPLVIDDREHSWFRWNVYFTVFCAFIVQVTVNLGVEESAFAIVLPVALTIVCIIRDNFWNISNNPDYLHFFAVAIIGLPLGIARPLFIMQKVFGEDQWMQVLFMTIWILGMEILRLILLTAFRRGVHQHEDSWVVLFPLRMLDVMATTLFFLFIEPSGGWIVIVVFVALKDLLRNTGAFYELCYHFTHPNAMSHEFAIWFLTWYNLCIQTVTSEIMAVIMVSSVLATEILFGEQIGYIVTGTLTERGRLVRMVQFSVILGATIIIGELSILYMSIRLGRAKRFMWRTNRLRTRGDVDLINYPSLLNKNQSSNPLFLRAGSGKHMFFYMSMAVAIFGTTLYQAVLIDRLDEAGEFRWLKEA